MRTAYCMALHEIMQKNNRVFALTADIGYRNFDDIIADFPKRFINVGVAEANMMGLAAGLAMFDKIPFTFTIAPFVTMRCLEQIRVDLCYQKLPVKIIGAGGGFVYGPQGVTHHAIEEIGMLRTLPNMTIISPADPVQTGKAIYATMEIDGPVYIRIGRNNEPAVYPAKYAYQIGKADILLEGEDISLIAHGSMVKNSLDAASILSQEGIRAKVINMHTVKPVDRKEILRCAKKTSGIITVEEHNVIGGLGSAVAEVLAEESVCPVFFKRLGLNDTYLKMTAKHADLQHEYGLDCEGIALIAKQLLFKKNTFYMDNRNFSYG